MAAQPPESRIERANWSKLPVSELKATLIYDGACGVCRWWVGYWQQLTGGQVLYRAYQEAADDFPEIPRDALARAIWLVEPNGSRCSAAAATFRLLSFAPGHGGWWWAYRRLPGFAPATERAYAVLAKRRGALAALTRLMWGSVPTPSRHALISWAFLKGLGAIYVAAFASLTVQVLGLVGQSGILPLSEDLAAARQAWGAAAYWRMPTLFWLDSSDSALVTATVIGIVVGILIIAGRLVTPALIAGYVLYLSLVYAGQIFLDYQWDQLLLEAGFLGIFLATGPPIVIWLYRWLLFRFIFLAGLMKLVSGDPTWRQLTALDYHFWTQPLPTPLAWYAAQLPRIGLAGATAAVLVIELVLVFLALLPRRPRCLAAAAILLLQLAIMATGNYGFFNLLTILLCLPLLDDAALSRLIPPRVVLRMHAKTAPPGRTAITAATILALVVVPLGINRIWQPLTGTGLPMISELTRILTPLQIVNPYGLFATVTTTRPELVFEGSDDGKVWREYAFRYAPGPVDRAPRWNIPYQPRLDWQSWFASYDSASYSPWVARFAMRLLEGNPAVLELLADNPFPAQPPKFVRAQLYEYHFAIPSPASSSRNWWVRRIEGLYLPPTSLSDLARSVEPPGAVPPLPGMQPRF